MAVSLYLYTTLGGGRALYLPLLLSAFALQNFRLAAVVVIISFGKIFRWFFDSPKSFASKFSLNSVFSDNWLWPHGICHCILDFWGAKLLTWLQSKKSNSIDFAFGDSSIFNLRPPAVFGMCQRVKQKFSSFCQIPLASPSIYISFPSAAAASAVVFISFVTFALVYASVRLKNASLVLWGERERFEMHVVPLAFLFFFSFAGKLL